MRKQRQASRKGIGRVIPAWLFTQPREYRRGGERVTLSVADWWDGRTATILEFHSRGVTRNTTRSLDRLLKFIALIEDAGFAQV